MSEFDESETAGPPRFSFGDDFGRYRPISFVGEQLQQALVGHAVRQTAYIKFGHIFLVLIFLDPAGYKPQVR